MKHYIGCINYLKYSENPSRKRLPLIISFIFESTMTGKLYCACNPMDFPTRRLRPTAPNMTKLLVLMDVVLSKKSSLAVNLPKL